MAAYRYLAVSALATVWAWGLACGAWKTEVATSAKQDSFLYVYDVPDMFTQRIVDMPLDRDKAPWSLWYDQDQMLHHYLKGRAAGSPQGAKLFFIPLYIGQFYHSLRESSNLDHWQANNQTSQLVLQAITWAKQTHPFWNRTNGLDHFMVFPLDHGRCHALGGLSARDFGDLFAIQPPGDVTLRDFQTGSWYCYRPGRDVLIPLPTEERLTLEDIVLPQATRRNISVLYRFTPYKPGGVEDRGNGDRTLRADLIQAHRRRPIPDSEEGWAPVEQTHEDMKHSIFCVCPPGISQHTLRVYRAIIFGCIPVTLFKANESPYEQFSGINYSKFTVNINPDERHLLQPTLTSLLARPHAIAELQASLSEVQSMFVYDQSGYGVQEAVFEELLAHPSRNMLSASRQL